jgi:hypothetical protein
LEHLGCHNAFVGIERSRKESRGENNSRDWK